MPEPEKIQRVIDGWLKTAAEGLCDEARGRVRAEIGAHFRDDIEARTQAGAASAEALQEALLALGDPQEARRRMRRVYLTEEDERKLGEVLPPATRWSWIYTLCRYTLLLGFCAYLMLNPDWLDARDRSVLSIYFSVILFLEMANSMVDRRLRSAVTRRRLLALIFGNLLGDTVFLIFLVATVIFIPQGRAGWPYLFMAIFYFLNTFRLIRIWRKLRRTSAARD